MMKPQAQLPVVLLYLLVHEAAIGSAKPSLYWGSYSGYLSALLDETFTNRSVVFARPKGLVPAQDVGTENDGGDAPWFVSNVNASSLGGMTKLCHAP